MAKAYSAASALHAMALLQVYQAKVLKDMQEGSADPGLMQELCVTKVTAQSLGQTMSTLVVQERHLWLNLAEIRDDDKVHFLDSSISQASLFGNAVENFAQQFSAVQQQTEASKHILPDVMLLPTPVCLGRSLRLLVAEGGLFISSVSRPQQQPSPRPQRRAPHRKLMPPVSGNGQLRERGSCSSGDDEYTAPFRQAENPLFQFVCVLPLVSRPAVHKT